MLTGKRAKTLMTAGLVAAGATTFAGGAQAQSNEQLLRMIQQLNATVEELKVQVEDAQMKGEQATLAAADTKKKMESGDVKWKWGPSPTIQSGDGKFEMHVRGRLLVDFGHVSDKADKQDRNGTEFRALRLGIEGKAWKDFKYKMEIDFAENTVDITDAFLEYAGWDPMYVLVGHAKTTNSLEELTSSRHIDLVERGGFTDAFNFNRRIGVQIGYVGEWFRFDVGAFGSELDEPDVDFNDEGYALSARAVAYPEIGNGGILHIGASILYRDYDNDFSERDVRYRQRPHAHISGIRYVDTGGFKAGSDLFYGVELAGIMGPFWANAEWGWLKVKDITGQAGRSATFSGGYFGVGWFVTGEQRGYDEGTFDRPKKVNKPVFEGGFGAIALVARVDYVDLNATFGAGPCVTAASGICGGEQLTYIFGVNWFLNRHTVIKLNYAHSDVDDAFDNLGDTFPDGKNKINSFTARFQVDW
jgi:phosphate-selective porin OprO/OprP